MTALFKHFREKLAAKFAGKVHRAENGLHVAYLTAAFFEGHGIYAIAAVVLAIVCIVAMLLGEH